MVKKLWLLLLLSSLICHANQTTDSSYWFTSPKSSGSGFAVTAQTNLNDALYYNPAGLNTLKESSINLSYSSTYSIDCTNINIVSNNPIMNFGIGLIQNQSSGIEKTIFDQQTQRIQTIGKYNYSYSALFFGGAMSLPFVPYTHIGANFHLHQMSIDNDKLRGQSVNAGVLITPLPFFSIGYTKYNIIPFKLNWVHINRITPGFMDTIHTVKPYSRIGAELKVLNIKGFKWRLFADISDQTSKTELYMGTDLISKNITLRGGYNSRYFSAGVSTRINIFELNYAFLLPKDNKLLENRHDFGISVFIK